MAAVAAKVVRKGSMEKHVAKMATRLPTTYLAVQVGFLEGATYPNGTPVAMVGLIQELGAPRARIPPRPFFRPMLTEFRSTWSGILKVFLKANNMDGRLSLEQMGEYIAGQLRASLISVNTPALSQVTLLLRMMRSKDQTLVVGKRAVWAAIGMAKKGITASGVSTKPLDDTGFMLQSIDYRIVNDDESGRE